MIIRRSALLSLSLAAAALAQPSDPAANDNLNLRFANGIAAVVEHKVITVDDIRREIAPLIPQIQRESRNEREFNQKLEAQQDEIIQGLIDRVLIVKEFYKDEKRRIPSAFVDSQIADIQAEQFEGDRSKFLAYLRARGITLREYRKEVEEDIIYNYMRQQQRKSFSTVSPVQMETFYNENKERFYRDDAVHLRLIQFNRRGGETDAELRAKAIEVRGRFDRGEKFEDLAREYSQDSRRSRGGDWDWQKKTDLKTEFSEPLFSLKKGEMTEPIILPEGCFLLYVEDRVYAGIQPIDEVRTQIEQMIIRQMAAINQERWLERLRRNGYVRHY
jgi:peptidyl-prolyl cis-trans isomerase SurA